MEVPRAACQLPVSSCPAQPKSLSTVSVGAWFSSASLPCELGAFPSGAWLWVQNSPSTALDAVCDPLNLYCLHRGSTGHTCSLTQVPRELLSPSVFTSTPRLPNIPVHSLLSLSLHILPKTKEPG